MDKTRMNLSNNKFNQLLRKDVKEFNTFILSSLCILFLVTVGFISYKINSSYALFTDTIKGEKTIEVTVETPTYPVYSWNTAGVDLGATKDSISGYTTDYTTLGKSYFLKHNLASDNIVKTQEVCYILNSNQYCLKGGDNGASYEKNKATLYASFGEDNCSVDSNKVECSVSNVSAYAPDTGSVRAGDNTGTCYVNYSGKAYCM